jgi:RecA/RadA recombinase
MGTDYWQDPRSRLLKIKQNNGQVSTGWTALDQKLFGGLNRGELNIFAGGCVTGETKVEIVRLFDIEEFAQTGVLNEK